MKEETAIWLKYAVENYEAASVLYESKLFNPSLHNIQQCIEKSVKALLLEFGQPIRKTHSITDLVNLCEENEISVSLSEEECSFLDSIYLPTKYPLGSALPYFEPDEKIVSNALEIAIRVLDDVRFIISAKDKLGEPTVEYAVVLDTIKKG